MQWLAKVRKHTPFPGVNLQLAQHVIVYNAHEVLEAQRLQIRQQPPQHRFDRSGTDQLAPAILALQSLQSR
jgi:hypothetical protein